MRILPIKFILHPMLFLILLTAMLGTPLQHTQIQAKNKPALIRDTEIENTLKTWLAPLKKAAGMEHNKINIILIQNNQLNAFVAGGANIFFYTGLIEQTKTPEELIGVMAHELGHITGGHLIASSAAMQRASYESIIGMVVGIGAAILTGSPEAAQAISMGTRGIAATRYLSHSRTNESAADQAALTVLEKAKINPSGLSTFLKTLESEEFLPTSRQSEYVRTHPLTYNRIDALKRRTALSAYKDKKLLKEWYSSHERMKAKLLGYTSPQRVPWVYSDHDNSIPARYARAIAAYRQNNIETAIENIDDLLTEEPENPYFLELKGQMLVEFGRLRQSLPAYKKAIKLLPSADLIRIAYAHALIEAKPNNAELKEAIKHLDIASKTEQRNTQIHRLSAIAYGKLGDETRAKLHLSEEALLQRRLPYAKELALHVKNKAKENSPDHIKAQDILSHIKTLEKTKKK